MRRNAKGHAHAVKMTTGSLWKNILFFSLPLMLSQLLEVLFNLSDVAVAGKCADYKALGAVGSSILCAFKLPAMEHLPLYDMGLYWILPAVIFGLLVFGLAAIVKPEKKKANAEAKI